MTEVQQSAGDGSVTIHLCKICKNLDKSIAGKACRSKKISNSREQLPNTSLHSPTSARSVDVEKAPASALGVAAMKASPKQVHSMFAADNDEKSECSNNISNNSSNNSCNNSSNNGSINSLNNNGNNSALSVKVLTVNLSDSSRLQPTEDGEVNNILNVSMQLPRSRLSTFAPTPLHPAMSTQSSPLSIGRSEKTINCSPTESSLSSRNISRLDASLVKNGTVISSMVTYANSIRDTVEGAIASQQGSIESKLGEISGFLSVLPSLTQKIGDLESKVDSLEALLVDRNNQIAAIANECEQLRKIVNNQTVVFDTKFVILEKNFTSTVKSI